MRTDIVAIADRFIPKPKELRLVQRDYVTRDIINEVLSHFEKTKNQLVQFAPYLKGANKKDTCFTIWKFWRDHIRYQADDAGAGYQIVKSPAAVWADKFCDCKSFSIATMCCLYALGIKGVFRFVSFSKDTPTIPTHVYVVAYDERGKEIKIDCCLPDFDNEKKYQMKYDYLPKGLHSVTGIGRSPYPILLKKGIDLLRKRAVARRRSRCGELDLDGIETGEISEGLLGLMIEEQRLEMEQEKVAAVHGIGSPGDRSYEVELAAINNAIYALSGPVQRSKRCQVQLKVAEIGKKPNQRKAARQERKTQKAIKRNEAGKAVNKKQAKKLTAMNIAVKKKKEGFIKKAAAAVKKAVTAPFRLVAKGILETQLPKSAPVFLYLFIEDPKVLAKAPAVVIAKRNNSKKIADRIVNKIGMKRVHFMGILRNGIMREFGDTPENVIAKWMRDANFSIGVIPGVVAAGAKFLKDILVKIGAGKIENLNANAPAPEDWLSAAAREDMARDVQEQPSNNDVLQDRGMVPIKTDPEIFSDNNEGYSPYNDPGRPSAAFNSYTPNSFDSGGDFDTSQAKTLENVTVKSKPGESDPPDETKSGSMILPIAIVSLLLLAGGKKSKRA